MVVTISTKGSTGEEQTYGHRAVNISEVVTLFLKFEN